MREIFSERLEGARVLDGPYASRRGDKFGVFSIRGPQFQLFKVIAVEDGEGWDHVSVSLRKRTPTWDEMCFIKRLFWGDEECVVQYHPPASVYVNQTTTCLHLWAKVGGFPMPPTEFV